MSGRKKKKTLRVLIIVGVILAVIIGGVVFLAGRFRDIARQMMMPSRAVVTVGSISKKVDGAGNITVADSIELKIPSEITIGEKLAKAGDTVRKGDIVATVNKDSVTSAIVKLQNELDQVKQSLKNKKKDKLTDFQIEELETRKTSLENRIDLMMVYYNNPVVVAPEDGIVYSKEEASEGGLADKVNIGDYAKYLSSDGQGSLQKITSPVKAADGDTVITDFGDLSVEVPVKGGIPQTVIDGNGTYSGEIVWACDGSSDEVTEFAPGTQYSAMIVLTPGAGYEFSTDYVPVITGIEGDAQITIVEGKMVIGVAYPATEDETPSDPTEPADPTAPADPTSTAEPAFPSFNPDSFDYEEYLKMLEKLNKGGSGFDLSNFSSIGGLPSGLNYGDIASAYGMSGTGTNSYNDTVVMNIARTDNVKISIMVNELDILSVREGQTATIRLDAVPDKTFEGTISNVAQTAEASEGMANYKVDILIPMDSQMRIGMSANASIVINNAENILLLPMKALQQKGDQLFVYRSCDENGVLKDEQLVTTGLSDSNNVEIVSGLKEGDVVYFVDNSSNPLMQYMTEAEGGEATQ